MKMKLEEFLKLQQGNMSVLEYTSKFEHLAQYAPEHVDNEVKKRDCYLRGFNVRMQQKLVTCTLNDYASAVSVAISSEAKMNALDEFNKEEALKRKNVSFGPSGSAPQRLRWCSEVRLVLIIDHHNNNSHLSNNG